MNYKILKANTLDGIAHEVNELIMCGYIPVGGMLIDGDTYVQPMLASKTFQDQIEENNREINCNG